MANPLSDKRPDNLSGRKLTLRLSESQRERIDKRAEAMGISASAFGRAVILDFIEGKDHLPTALTKRYTGAGVELSEDVVELRKDLRRVGVNLNQVARIANRDRRVSISVSEELREVRGVLDEILRRLGDVRA
ncbi:MobC family plasmid mobilization relaxosome protein [Dermabacter vaginalis]|uniref:MobC family plasmid mobilization relaxosome protein n=1 Tax=Dermabacter vaginalis TaxID=1630135 RepID=UPI0021A89698|nr:MobC family plasmid mobilization relaxosome protein [Dermabacter vaginalis]MCT2149584.1 MobC family plasmid mobilization relaxosome protein [Dermabacter vaginalis]